MDIIDKIIDEEIEKFLAEAGKCQKGYKTHKKRKTKKMYGKTYRNCVKAEAVEDAAQHVANKAVRDKITNAEALKAILNDPPIPDDEVRPWLERHGLKPDDRGFDRSSRAGKRSPWIRDDSFDVFDISLEEDKPIHTAVKLRIAEVDGLDEKKKKKKKRKGGKRDGKGASSKGYSLRDWFKGGGWVQTGGKYDGKPCAKQPGQKTKPYCRDPDDRAKLSKKDRDKRARKKRREDPNPNRRGKAKNVRQKKKGKKK